MFCSLQPDIQEGWNYGDLLTGAIERLEPHRAVIRLDSGSPALLPFEDEGPQVGWISHLPHHDVRSLFNVGDRVKVRDSAVTFVVRIPSCLHCN